MFLEPVEIINIKKTAKIPPLSRSNMYDLVFALLTVDLYYYPSFLINEFRWVCLSSIIIEEGVTFNHTDTNLLADGTILGKGRVITCELRTPSVVFLEIHITEVTINE